MQVLDESCTHSLLYVRLTAARLTAGAFDFVRTLILFLSFFLYSAGAVFAQTDGFRTGEDRVHPVLGRSGMVATQEAHATRVGLDILQRGGNAVDAAVAVGFALAATLPRAGNLGGGGFMMIHDAKSGRTIAIDYRETAPAAATRDMYLDTAGNVDKQAFRFSHKAIGIPGTVAGLTLALRKYGIMALKDVMAPALRLAGDGFLVSDDMARQLDRRQKRLAQSEATRKIFFADDDTPLKAGDRLVQRDLWQSLKAISEKGPYAFYRGTIAKRIVAEMKANDGVMTLEDLAGYAPVEREAVRGTYRGYEIQSMPPPSSGGIHIVQILNMLEGYDLAAMGHNSAGGLHLMAEAMKRAYADRSKHLGDPGYWKVPVTGLVSKEYAAVLRRGIDPKMATPSTEILPGDPAPYEGPNTTHYTVMDRFGNTVTNTYTLNFSYGTGIVAAGTGILLNNEMGDFSAKPGVPNAYGLIGGDANAVGGGKRPLSSMSPTIVLKDGKVLLATGSPGGSRIITTVLQLLINVIDHKMNIAEATHAPRVHHQWLPDTLRIEEGLSPDTQRLLGAMGHTLKQGRPMGSLQSIMRVDGILYGASDPRRPDALTLGY
jgi:gamma-glutamyltranspeptidase/glutathione hydrolase